MLRRRWNIFRKIYTNTPSGRVQTAHYWIDPAIAPRLRWQEYPVKFLGFSLRARYTGIPGKQATRSAIWGVAGLVTPYNVGIPLCPYRIQYGRPKNQTDFNNQAIQLLDDFSIATTLMRRITNRMVSVGFHEFDFCRILFGLYRAGLIHGNSIGPIDSGLGRPKVVDFAELISELFYHVERTVRINRQLERKLRILDLLYDLALYRKLPMVSRDIYAGHTRALPSKHRHSNSHDYLPTSNQDSLKRGFLKILDIPLK